MMSLLDLMHAPPVRRVVEPDGPVVKEPREVHGFYPRGPRVLWCYADIKLHPHDDGSWMWSVSYGLSGCGSSYQVGPKWGRFAETRADALYHAQSELIMALSHSPDDADAKKIIVWARGI